MLPVKAIVLSQNARPFDCVLVGMNALMSVPALLIFVLRSAEVSTYSWGGSREPAIYEAIRQARRDLGCHQSEPDGGAFGSHGGGVGMTFVMCGQFVYYYCDPATYTWWEKFWIGAPCRRCERTGVVTTTG